MRVRLFLAAAALLLAVPARPAVPQRVNYQGKLANAAGDPLSGTYSFRFKLFAAETGGAALFSEDVAGSNAQSVVNGIYSVQIGSYTPGGIPWGVFSGADLYLEIDVQAGASLAAPETLAPRERLNAAAWAVHALGAERLGAGAVIATFTSAGNLLVPYGVNAASGSLGALTASSLTVTGAGSFGSAAARSTFTAAPGGAAFALQTASGVFVASGPVYLSGAGAHLRFPDGTTMATAGGAGAFVSKLGDTMTGQLTISGSSLTVVHSGNAQGFVLAATSATDRSSYHLYVATTGGVSMGRAGEPTAGSRLDVAGPLFAGSTPGSLFFGAGGWPYSIGVGWNGQDSTLRFNAVGTGGGTADFRDIIVYDGKTNPIAAFDGSTARFGVNTTGPASDVDVSRPAGSYPTFRLSDGNVTLPDYSGSSSVGEVSLSNAVLHIKSNRGGSGTTATGGALLQGFTEAGVNDWVPLHLVGTHGGTAPTSAAVTISGQKHSGTNNRSALAGSEPVLDVETNYGGTLLMRVEGGGRVGVGAVAPAARLHVSSPAAGGETVLHVSSGAAAEKPLLTVRGDGAVGIGTANPFYALDVYRGATAATVNLQGTGDTYNFSGFNLWSDEATDKYWALFHRKGAGEVNNLLLEEFDGSVYKQRMIFKPDGVAAFGNSTTKTQIELQGAGDTYNYTSTLYYNHDWTRYWALLHRKGAGQVNDFYFEEFDGTNYNVRLAFKPGGNVGLGTSAPAARLHVSSAGATSADMLLVSTGATNLLKLQGDGTLHVHQGVTAASATVMGGTALKESPAPAALSGYGVLFTGAGNELNYRRENGDLFTLSYSTVIVKFADESLASSIALQDDDHLKLAIAANETWMVEYTIFASGPGGGQGNRFALNGPAGLAGLRAAVHLWASSPNSYKNGGIITAYDTAVTDNYGGAFDTVHYVRGYVENGGTAGTLALRWAQHSSNTNALTIHKGSFLKATRIR